MNAEWGYPSLSAAYRMVGPMPALCMQTLSRGRVQTNKQKEILFFFW